MTNKPNNNGYHVCGSGIGACEKCHVASATTISQPNNKVEEWVKYCKLIK